MTVFNVYGNFMRIYALTAVNNMNGVWFMTPCSVVWRLHMAYRRFLGKYCLRIADT